MNAIISLCHFCESHGPSILFCTQAFHQSQDAQLLHDSAPPGDYRGHTNSVDPLTQNLSAIVHQPPTDQCDACRSLSPGQPGFISYDESTQITYISCQHPEQQQLYSILRQACVRSLNCEVCPGREGPIVFGEDSSCHTLSHTFNLCDRQARGFSRLYSFIIVMRDRMFLVNSWPFLVKHLRSLIDNLQKKAEKTYSLESDEHKLTSSSRLLPSHGGRRLLPNQTYRSLVDLTGDKDIYVYLHKYFIYLIKTGGRRMMECIVEGPPQAMAVTDSFKMLSDQELIEKLDKSLPSAEFRVLQLEDQPIFNSLRHFVSILGSEDFPELAYHIMRGDQLIVRGNDPSTVMSVLNILKELVPESICRIIGFSSTYQESFVAEFLGLSVGVNLPRHIVDSELHVLLDILPPLKRYYSKSAGDQPNSVLGGADIVEPLEKYKLMVYSAQPCLHDQKYPVIIRRLMALLTGDGISDQMVSRGILALKEEWMNKVKILYKFSQVYPKDSLENDEKLNKLVKEVLFVTPEDMPILLHWRSALRKDYRAHLLQK